MNNSSMISRIVAVFVGAACFLGAGEIMAQDEDSSETEQEMVVESLPELPYGITSFGAAVCDGHLYAFGGNRGSAHSYYRSGQNNVLLRLDLNQPKEWEEIDQSPNGRQGLAMVAHGGKIYRLGGFEARNEKGDEQDAHSLANFDMFDPATGEWTELLAMPEPRSSFDAVVVDDTLYVIGGWALAGPDNTVWSETAYSIDLSNLKSEWQELPKPPFIRRAMSVAFQDGNLFVIGGMQKVGGPTRAVDIFNIKTGEWSEGQELPGEEGMEGFGNSSFNVGGKVCVTTYGGNVFTLNSKGDAWEKLGSLDTGRFFHRLLPIADDKFVLVGGANMESGKTTEVEVINIDIAK